MITRTSVSQHSPRHNAVAVLKADVSFGRQQAAPLSSHKVFIILRLGRQRKSRGEQFLFFVSCFTTYQYSGDKFYDGKKSTIYSEAVSSSLCCDAPLPIHPIFSCPGFTFYSSQGHNVTTAAHNCYYII